MSLNSLGAPHNRGEASTSLAGLLSRQSRPVLATAVLAGVGAGLGYGAVVAVIALAIEGKTAWTVLSGQLAVACGVYLGLRLTSTKLMLETSQAAIQALRLELCRRILGTPQEVLQEVGKSHLVTAITQDMDSLAVGYEALTELLRNAVVIVASLAYLGSIDWRLLLIFGAILLAGVQAVDRLQAGPTRVIAQAHQEQDRLYAHLRNLVDGTRELQLNSAKGQAHVADVIAPEADRLRRQMVRGFLGFVLVLGAGEIVYFLAIGVLIFVVPQWLTLQPGAIALAAVTVLFIGVPINDLLQALPKIGRAKAALAHIQSVERHAPVADRPVAGDAFAATGPVRLDLRDVAYHYEGSDGRFAVGPLDLAIGGGETVFLIGGNGSGKSTLAMVLLGLFRAQSGEISLNGALLTEENRREYSQHFSAIFSDFHLFDSATPEKSDRIDRYAAGYLKLMQLDHKVSVEHGQFSTTDLSAGQRKRLAMVSAYLEDRPIYLFDEWAADQDPAFKHLFYTKLVPDLKAAGKAVIVITHDDDYFDCADRVLRVENGTLSEITPSAGLARRLREPHAAFHSNG